MLLDETNRMTCDTPAWITRPNLVRDSTIRTKDTFGYEHPLITLIHFEKYHQAGQIDRVSLEHFGAHLLNLICW